MQEYNSISVFFPETFRSFLLRHLCHWNVSVICVTVVLIRSESVFSLFFKHSDRNDLIFFGHFKIFWSMNEKWLKQNSSIFQNCVEYHKWFFHKFEFLPVLVITTEYKYFRFCSMQVDCIWILFVTFPKHRCIGMGLSTRAPRLLHKCRENDTI